MVMTKLINIFLFILRNICICIGTPLTVIGTSILIFGEYITPKLPCNLCKLNERAKGNRYCLPCINTKFLMKN